MAKILLVEDDKSLREIYGVRLMAEGYEIVSAGDGEEALALAIKERPDLIVSDVMMPKISGFDMLDILRSTSETKDVKVIMMTALSSEDQRARGEALGADRYLVKSQVGIEDVVRTVHDVLGDSIGAGAAPQAAPAAPSPAPEAPAAAPAPVAPAPEAPQPVVSLETQPPVQPVEPIAPAPQPVSQPEQPAAPAPEPIAAPAYEVPAPVTPEPQAPVTPEPTPIAPAPETPQPQVLSELPAQPAAPAPEAPQPVEYPMPEAAPAQPIETNPPIAPVPPTPEPAPQPEQPVAPTPAPEPFQMPQPTAPFSSPAPASLADRVIQPLSSPDDQNNISDQMQQALNNDAPSQPQPPQGIPPVPPGA